MKNISYLIAAGEIEVRKANAVFGKDAFGLAKGSRIMSTIQYDPLTGRDKNFHQDDYYFFMVDGASLDAKIADLEATIKQGVWF